MTDHKIKILYIEKFYSHLVLSVSSDLATQLIGPINSCFGKLLIPHSFEVFRQRLEAFLWTPCLVKPWSFLWRRYSVKCYGCSAKGPTKQSQRIIPDLEFATPHASASVCWVSPHSRRERISGCQKCLCLWRALINILPLFFGSYHGHLKTVF